MNVAAQSGLVKERALVEASSGNGAFYWALFIVLLGLGAAYFFWRRSGEEMEQPKPENRSKSYYRQESFELGDLDADLELEWLRKAKRSAREAKKPTIERRKERAEPAMDSTDQSEELSFDTRAFQEKMRMLQYAQLPINSFNELLPAKSFEPLPVSNDRALLTAIEQVHEEYEEDEAIRELAVRILAAFRTSNSVEALSQISLYDLSANLRSKAVSILAEFDHETVFETILLACADPTREVRAAAARGLFRLNFDRSDAWKRLIETGDEFRMSHAVRAAIESGIVQKSFDRLVHEDLKIAYEAYTLVALMISAGETTEIYNALREHKDERVKLALLHVIKTTGDARAISGLSDLIASSELSADVIIRITDIVNGYVPVCPERGLHQPAYIQ